MKHIWEYCETLMHDIEDVLKSPGDFNQALMEVGAMICSPSNPKCDLCPLNKICEAKITNKTTEFPLKVKKQKANPILNVVSFVLKRKSDDAILIKKRLEKGLLENQFELINFISSLEEEEEEEEILKMELKKIGSCNDCIKNRIKPKLKKEEKKNFFIHKFSHLTHHVVFYEYEVENDSPKKCIEKSCLFHSNHKSELVFETSTKQQVKWINKIKNSGLTRQHTKTLELL